jgi:thiol-disulfide isomerase/thioredoxin
MNAANTAVTPRPVHAVTSPPRAAVASPPVNPALRAIVPHLCAIVFAAVAGTVLAADAADGVKPGLYRVVLQSPGGDLPFGLDLERQGTRWIGYLINGKERLKLDEVAVKGPQIEISMPGYETRLTAVATVEGLQGEIYLDKLGGKDQHIPLSAQFGRAYRFFPTTSGGGSTASGDGAQVAGRWAVTFSEDGGATEAAVGEFSQTRDIVTGTVLTATGDHRFLAGQVRGDELYLSTFDGAHVFLYRAKMQPDGTLAGDFWSGAVYHERWTARRDTGAALPDAYSLTTLRAGNQSFEFAFPDLAGNLVTSKDPKFRHKVVIVALAGSWCPNCHDEAAFLAPVYRDYRARGLEIVSLMFEHFGDFDRAAAATGRFRQHYGIEYTTLIAGVSDKDDAAKKLPALDRVYAFPTLIFIDRSGRVRKIHTGYSGPATGAHYTQFVAEFKSTLDELLAET